MKNEDRSQKGMLRGNFKYWILLSLAISLTGFWACTHNTPLGPDYSDKNLSVSPGTSASSPVTNQTSPSDLEFATIEYEGNKVFKLLGMLGGTLNVPLSNGYSYFNVPAGALLTNVLLSIQATQGRNSEGERITEYEFWPDGLLFQRSSTLNHKTVVPDGAVVELWWYNEDTHNWELNKITKSKNGRCTYPVNHFSKYRVYEGSVSASGQ